MTTKQIGTVRVAPARQVHEILISTEVNSVEDPAIVEINGVKSAVETPRRSQLEWPQVIVLVVLVAFAAAFATYVAMDKKQQSTAGAKTPAVLTQPAPAPQPLAAPPAPPAPTPVVAPAAVAPNQIPSAAAMPGVGETCEMSYPHKGEQGYVWSDGQCHHLPVSYDRQASLGNERIGSKNVDEPPHARRPQGREQYGLNDTCPMSGLHKGERGYVWPDGQCHHIRYNPRRH